MMWEHNKRTVVDVGTKQKTFVDAETKKTLVDVLCELCVGSLLPLTMFFSKIFGKDL